MIATVTETLMTGDEFLRLHGDESGVELVRGKIVRKPIPGQDHYQTQSVNPPTSGGTLELLVIKRTPSDSIRELSDKAYEYLEAGVRCIVVLDPPTESAAVYRLNELPQRFHNGDTLTLPDVLPEFAVPVAKFFE